MGKSRRNRGNAAHRNNPLGGGKPKAVKPPSDPELAALREAKILPVMRDLQSADPKARSAAAAAVSSIIQDQRCRKLLLREQIVHTVMNQTLTDAALESRAAGWGILQVLAREEEPDFCVHLYRVDVLTAIEYAAKSIADVLRSKDLDFSKRPKAEQATIVSIVASIVSLVTALAEAQDDILEAVAQNAPVLKLVLLLLSSDELTAQPNVLALRSDALACLMILCEDNPELADRLVASRDPNCYDALVALRADDASSSPGDAVLACGVLHNVFASLDQRDDVALGADDSLLIPALSKALASFEPSQSPPSEGLTGWANPLEYQQLALEILASIGTSLNGTPDDRGAKPAAAAKKPEGRTNGAKDDEDMADADAPEEEEDENAKEDQDEGEGEGEGDEEEEDDEMDQDELEADMEMVTGADSDVPDEGSIDELPVLKSLLSTALPQLIRLAAPPDPPSDAALALQAHALAALSNIAWSVSLLDFADPVNGPVQAAWDPAARALWAGVVAPVLAADTADVGLAARVTGLAWAVARSLNGRASPLADDSDEHRRFITLYRATTNSSSSSSAAADNNTNANGTTTTTTSSSSSSPQDDSLQDPFQALGVKCIGVLGQLALAPCPVSRNRDVGAFLVALVGALPATPAADAVEALNQLFDVYADEAPAYDRDVFWRDGFLGLLDDALPRARAMLKTIDKRAQPELRARADQAVLNLTRFLAYKRKNKPKE